jgi:hypothetical protein
VKADPSRVSFHAIVGMTPGGCIGPSGAADYGSRYLEVADYFGGVKASICGMDWGLALENVAATASALRSRFALSSVPVPSTIAVAVDGISNMNWSYDSATNTVIFEPSSVPPESATVEVTYAIACGA